MTAAEEHCLLPALWTPAQPGRRTHSSPPRLPPVPLNRCHSHTALRTPLWLGGVRSGSLAAGEEEGTHPPEQAVSASLSPVLSLLILLDTTSVVDSHGGKKLEYIFSLHPSMHPPIHSPIYPSIHTPTHPSTLPAHPENLKDITSFRAH